MNAHFLSVYLLMTGVNVERCLLETRVIKISHFFSNKIRVEDCCFISLKMHDFSPTSSFIMMQVILLRMKIVKTHQRKRNREHTKILIRVSIIKEIQIMQKLIFDWEIFSSRVVYSYAKKNSGQRSVCVFCVCRSTSCRATHN